MRFAALAVAAVLMTGCSAVDPNGSASGVGDVGDNGDGPLVGADDSTATAASDLTAGQALTTTANLNLRKGPGTTYAVIVVIPSGASVKLLDATAQNGFLNISWNGNNGWSSGTYLKSTTTQQPPPPTTDPNGPPSPDNAIARAALSVGFSYWWGGGAWLSTGVTNGTAGTCSGSCPSCSHTGQYGADCSGMVAKAWQFGTVALNVDSHPYSTSSFVNDVSGKWSTVSRGSLKAGDALVYNSGGSGHIVLWESGDGWGSSTVYECKGCSYGCVHDTRTFSSAYHGIRRAGF